MLMLVLATVSSMVNSTEVPGTQTLWKSALETIKPLAPE